MDKNANIVLSEKDNDWDSWIKSNEELSKEKEEEEKELAEYQYLKLFYLQTNQNLVYLKELLMKGKVEEVIQHFKQILNSLLKLITEVSLKEASIWISRIIINRTFKRVLKISLKLRDREWFDDV